MLVLSRTILPIASRWIQCPGESGGVTSRSWIVIARCARAKSASTLGRRRSKGISQVTAAPRSGTKIRAVSINLLLFQRGQSSGIQRRKFPADVVENNAHDKSTDKKIKQGTDLNHDRHGSGQQQAEDEDAVFQEQIADNLRDRFATGCQDQKTAHQCGNRRWYEKVILMFRKQRQLTGETERKCCKERPEQQCGNVSQKRLFLALDLGVAHCPIEQ